VPAGTLGRVRPRVEPLLRVVVGGRGLDDGREVLVREAPREEAPERVDVGASVEAFAGAAFRRGVLVQRPGNGEVGHGDAVRPGFDEDDGRT
jgi:hypothetical protein